MVVPPLRRSISMAYAPFALGTHRDEIEAKRPMTPPWQAGADSRLSGDQRGIPVCGKMQPRYDCPLGPPSTVGGEHLPCPMA
jgi:hypothetical protein